MTTEETGQLLAVFKAMYPTHPVPNPEAMVTAYQMALDDLPAEAVTVAAREWMRTGVFFPKPAELRSIIAERGLSLPSPEEAWSEVMSQIRAVGSYGNPSWSCLAVRQAVDALGWRNICASEEIGIERAHFYRTYQAYRERTLRDTDLAALWSGGGQRTAIEAEAKR